MQASLRAHLDHMALKNWAFSLFNPDGSLYHHGFTGVRPTPAIVTGGGPLTPDLVAWDSSTVLVVECCSGIPNQNDTTKTDKYSSLPSDLYSNLTRIATPSIETILLYYDSKFNSNTVARDALLRAVSLRPDIVVWSCIPAITIKSEAGAHANQAVDSIMRGGAPLGPYPSPPIEIQPDSPLELLTRVLFRRLFESSMRVKDTTFALEQARDSIADQNYATDSSEEDVKLKRAVDIGVKMGLCQIENPSVRWRLTFEPTRPVTMERFLSRLTGMLSQPPITDF